MELYGRTGHYKIGTHDVRKSLFLSVYKHYKIGTDDVKKTLDLLRKSRHLGWS